MISYNNMIVENVQGMEKRVELFILDEILQQLKRIADALVDLG